MKKYCHRIFLALFAVAIVGCNNSKGRYVDLNNQSYNAAYQAATAGSANYASGGRQTEDYSSSLANDRKTYLECTKQCLRDENGELISDCPSYCTQYQLNYTRGVPYDQDLNPLISYQTAYGASRLGNQLGTPNMRSTLTNQYFHGDRFLPYQSQYFNQMYPNGGVFCPDHRNDCEDVVIRDPNYIYNISLLDNAAYKYQIGDPNADRYFYSVQGDIQRNSGGMAANFDFKQLGAQFKGMGQAILGGVVASGKGLVNNTVGGLQNTFVNAAGNVTGNMSRFHFSGMTYQYNPYVVSSSVNNMAYSAMYGTGPDRCSAQYQNSPYYYYACAQR